MRKQAYSGEPPGPHPALAGSAQQSDTRALDRSLALVCRGLFGERSELLKVGRFELVATLGRGGMGVAYDAFDPLHGEHVALKMLHDGGATGAYLLKREFRSLACLRHPNLARLYELFVERDLSYFTMERIRGVDFVSHVREGVLPGQLPDFARLHGALVQLCAGVRALHQAGKLHRDLKPANVLVDDAGRVVLLDFGLVHDLHDGGAAAEGTPAFMAPEQWRGAASEASDWYGVGCILHAALYGQPPGSCAAQAERRAHSCAADAVSVLEAHCAQLLSVDPARRPTAWPLGPAKGDAFAATAPETRGPSGPAFVGRELEQRELERALEQSQRAPLLVSLQGESGIGKTALMERFARQAQRELGALVFRGRCYERESVAYKAFDGIIDDLTRHLLSLSPERAQAVRPSDCDALFELFPVLGRVATLQPLLPRTAHEPSVERRHALAALKQLLAGLARERALVLCVDDIQWSDPDSDLLLASLLDDPDAPPLLVVATERIASTSGPEQRHPAHELARVVLTLAPLASHHTRALAQSFLPKLRGDHPVMQRIEREANGSPLLISTLSRWAFAHPHSGTTGPRATIDALIGTRLDALSVQQRLVLQLIVLSGRPTISRIIARAAGLEAGLEDSLTALRDAHLIHQQQRADDELLEPDHLSVREAVLARTSCAERASLHLRLAEVLEQTSGVLAAALVEQYVGAGKPREAARHARRAAEGALATFAFSSAIAFYERSLALGDWSLDEQQSLRRELARALEHAGRWREAVAVYRRAAALSTCPLATAQFEQRAALHLMNGGHYREGEQLLRAGYKTLGLPWPRSRILLWAHVLARSCMGQLPVPALFRRSTDDALHRARADFLADAGRALEEHDVLRAFHNALLCFEQSERVSDPRYPTRALAGRGFMRGAALGAGGAERGLPELQAACARAEQLHDDIGLIDIERQLASGYLLAGRPREALATADRCVARLRTQPRRREKLDTTMLVVGLALLELGELREFERRWSTYARASQAHSEVTRFWIDSHPARRASLLAAHERSDTDRDLEQQRRLAKLHPKSMLLQWAHVTNVVSDALYWGPSERALALVEQDWRGLTRSVYPVLRNEALFLRTRAWLEAACALPASARRARLLRRADAATCVLERRGGERFRAQLWILRAAIEQLQGRESAAVAQLERALIRCDQSEQKLLAASARFCRGALVLGERGLADRREATRTLQSEGIVSPLHWIAWNAPGFRTLIEAPS